MQQAPGLTTLPVEVLENIISYIDRPYDLLSLALTRKYFCFIIIPSHLSLRRVVLKLQDPISWKDLSERSYFFLERMRELRVVFSKRTNWIDELRDLSFPLYIDSHSPEPAPWYDLDDQRLREALSTYFDRLETLLKKSERLISFSIRYDYPIGRQVRDRLLSHLSSSSLLKELEISSSPLTQVNPTHTIPSLHHSQAFDISSLNFPRLSVLSLTIGSEMEGFRTLIEGPILNWVQLSDILLVSKTEAYLSSTNFFSRGRWPSLKRLTVHRFRIDTDDLESVTTMLQAFFQRHQTLERLSLAEYHQPTSFLGLWDRVQPARDLPSLKSLYFHFGDNFSIPLTFFNHLEHATIFGDITSEGDHSIPKMFPLKSLVYESSCPSRLVGKALQKAPVLERLALGCSKEDQVCF